MQPAIAASPAKVPLGASDSAHSVADSIAQGASPAQASALLSAEIVVCLTT